MQTRPARFLLVNAALVCCSWFLSAQNPQLRTRNGGQFPTVVFTSVLWSADPSYYSIAIDSSGAATYLSSPDAIEKTGVPFTIEFQATDRTRRLVFNIAQRLDFLADAPSQRVFLPEKNSVRTLAYVYGHLNNQFTYATPPGPDLEEITSVFEELAETFESGRRLVYLQQNDRNAIDSQLEHLEAQLDRHHLREFQALVPALRTVLSDRRLGADTRARVEKLLEVAQRWH